MRVEHVIKRDGRIVPFDVERITNAIYKAAKSVGGQDRSLSARLALEVCRDINYTYGYAGSIAVEEVQDIVEKILIKSGHAKTSKAYILYRSQRSNVRDIHSSLNSMEALIDDYIGENDWRLKENSNTTFSLQGLNNYISSTVTAGYWLNHIFPEEVRNAHKKGDLHLHDLGLLSVYCCGWDLKDFLARGFRGVTGKTESKPAKHFRTALGQIVNFFYTLQGEAAGAQAFANFDTLLAPYIRFDNLDEKSVRQSMQEFIFNLNIPTRVGFQTPFTNLTMDIKVPSFYADEEVIIAGERTGFVYGDFQNEMDMLNKAFIDVMKEGDASGRIFTFPIPTYNIGKDFDWDAPVVDNIMEMTGRYGTPYFANFINSDMSPDDARSMCCRLRLDNRMLRKRGGGLFGANPLTGSIGVVTINMPRIGYQAVDADDFYNRLRQLMDISRTALKIKRSVLENMTQKGLYPYSKYYLSDIKERFGMYWQNHFNTIGLVGMNEALLNFIGVDIRHENGTKFAEEVLRFMNNILLEYQEEDGELYNLEATPAEGTSYRLAKKDVREFPDIITAGEDNPFYTNSTQLPPDSGMDLFSSIEHQDRLQPLYTGGTVMHMFLGESVDDSESVKALVKRIAYSSRVPYFTLTPTFSICPVHGYMSGRHNECPICRHIEEEKINERISELKNRINYIKLTNKNNEMGGVKNDKQ